MVSPECDFSTFALDVSSCEFEAFWKSDGHFDYVLNLSALKHVRSEKDPFTLYADGSSKYIEHSEDIRNVYR